MDLLDLLIGAFEARLLKLLAKTLDIPNFDQLEENIWFGGINPVSLIIKHEFKRVLDLRDEASSDFGSRLTQNCVQYSNVKILDTHGTTITELDTIVNWLKSSNEKTLVHCNLGRGRAAMVSIAYLLTNGAMLNDAIKSTKKARSVVYINKFQRESLKQFSKYVWENNDK
jgi:protein-tyrosine phosphatase